MKIVTLAMEKKMQAGIKIETLVRRWAPNN